jgi:hypothetical protein
MAIPTTSATIRISSSTSDSPVSPRFATIPHTTISAFLLKCVYGKPCRRTSGSKEKGKERYGLYQVPGAAGGTATTHARFFMFSGK